MIGQIPKKAMLLTVGAMAVTACAAQPEATRPQAQPTAIERVVASDVEATWDALLSGIDSSDFTINSVAEADRTIRVLVQSAIPSTYVDCGEISVRSRHPEFGERNYNFPAANSARYLVADESADALVDVERRTSLNALASVRLTPNGQGTTVSINTRYVMTFKTREFGNDVETRNVDNRLDFQSLGSASQDEQIRVGADTKTVTVECRPTGELERRIVSALG